MKTVRKVCEWGMSALVIGVIGAALLINLNSGGTVSNSNKGTSSKTGTTTSSGTTAKAVNVPDSGAHFLDMIPDGGTMTYDEFKKTAGSDIAKLLSWASPQTVTRKGKHLIIDSASAASITTGGVTINIDSRVEFDVDTSGPGLVAKKIKGVTVKKGIIGPLPIRDATMTVDPATGNISIKGNLELSRWLPYIPFEVNLGPDGKPLP